MTERPQIPEGSVFERSSSGRRGFALPPLDVPKSTPRVGLRSAPAELPEISESDTVRHFTRLSHKNLATDLVPIVQGGLTMKHVLPLNEAIASFSGFAEVHPATPLELCQGSLEIISRLESTLCSLSGLDECSVQPGPASHALLAGLSMIRTFHEKHGSSRKLILVPDTVPASSFLGCQLAGYQPAPVRIGLQGIVVPELVSDALDTYGRDIAAMILCTPNTLGLFQPHILEIAELLHGIGAQLYLDGSNLNGLLGVVKPSDMGVDLMHFDARDFGVPPGGGGPEASALAVRAHLAPYLPNPRVKLFDGKYSLACSPDSIGRIGPGLGRFPELVRALAYFAEHGTQGVKRASRHAVINANYLKARLSEIFEPQVETPSLHQSAFARTRETPSRPANEATRALLARGWYPPVSPLPESLASAMLIEPTESESVQSLDRLVDAFAVSVRDSAQKENFDTRQDKYLADLGPPGPTKPATFSVDDRS